MYEIIRTKEQILSLDDCWQSAKDGKRSATDEELKEVGVLALSKSSSAVVIVHRKGFRVTPDGVLTRRNKLFINPGVKDGYAVVYSSCYNFGMTSINCGVHRLMAYQKYGNAIFSVGVQVRHLNGNSLDNSYDANDKPRSTHERTTKNAASYLRRFTDEEVVEILNDRYTRNMTLAQIRAKWNMCKATASYIYSGRVYKEVFDKFMSTR
jgi:hypothetical protein